MRTAGLVLLLAAAGLAALALDGAARPTRAQGPARVRLEPQTRRVDYADGAFTVRVELRGLDHHNCIERNIDADPEPETCDPSNGLGAFEVIFDYDPRVLDVVAGRDGGFLGSTGRTIQCLEAEPEPGRYRFGCVSLTSSDGPQGNGLLASVSFRPVANGLTWAPITVGLAGPLGDAIAVDAAGGIYEVFGAPRDAEDLPDPRLHDPHGGNGNGGPRVIGGGTPGDISAPGGSNGSGANASGGNGSSGNAPSAGNVAGRAANDPNARVPSAGTGYRPPDERARIYLLGGALAAAGAALLLVGARLRRRPP